MPGALHAPRRREGRTPRRQGQPSLCRYFRRRYRRRGVGEVVDVELP